MNQRRPPAPRDHCHGTFGNGAMPIGPDITVSGPMHFTPGPEMLRRARLAVCDRARDVADAAELLSALGLIGDET